MATAEPQPAAPDSHVAAPHSTSGARSTFGVGTRQSPLALAQTEIVLDRLRKVTSHNEKFQIHAQTTTGDKNQQTALHQMDAKALWTTELEQSLTEGTTDFIVHSLKDMPTQLPAGCSLGAALARTEPRDCIVMAPKMVAAGHTTLADLPAGSVIGTSSVRRLAQIRAKYPSLKTQDVRGNVGTRLRKLDDPEGPYAALVLAATGLQRLGLGERISSFLSRRDGGWLGAVGQGAIGVEIRHGDEATDGLCRRIMQLEESETQKESRVWLEILAERSLLRVLEGGCSVPVAVESEWRSVNEGTEASEGTEGQTTGGTADDANGAKRAEGAPGAGDDTKQLHLYALVASVDGKRVVERNITASVTSREQAEEVGIDLAARLVDGGAEEILKEIRLNRKIIAEAGGA